MQTIWKFPLETTDRQVIRMPVGSRILTVQTQSQSGKPCLWAVVDSDAPLQPRGFEICGTGHPMSINGDEIHEYIGTYQLNDGQLVFHVFEIFGDLQRL